MANDVFANGREISCKKADGKAIAAFPDVCFTPPENPATPPGVPLPYPNTGMAKDATSGSKSVKISGQEVMLRNKSYFKTSSGDEAGCAAKKGVITSKIKGKVYFTAWSMNVKIEASNAVRHLDMTTHNHASFPGNSPPWVYQDAAAGSAIKECEDEVDRAKNACKGKTTKEEQCKSKECRSAKKCLLVTYSQGKRKGTSSAVACCDGEQPHHLVEAHCFYDKGKRGQRGSRVIKAKKGTRVYKDNEAPCVCASGPRHKKEHGQYHAFQQALESAHHGTNGAWTYKDARNAGVKAHKAVNPQCSEECTAAQLDAYHKDRCGVEDNDTLRTDEHAGTRSSGSLNKEQKSQLVAARNAAFGVGKLFG